MARMLKMINKYTVPRIGEISAGDRCAMLNYRSP